MLLSQFKTVNNWFYENFMILNPGKCHFMSIGKVTHDEDFFSNKEEILGVTTDTKFTFHQHIKKMS